MAIFSLSSAMADLFQDEVEESKTAQLLELFLKLMMASL